MNEFTDAFERINEEYRRTVARHKAQEAHNEAVRRSVGLFISRLSAVALLIGSMAMVVQSIEMLITALRTGTTPTSPALFAISFMIVQICGWTYILLFPAYMEYVTKSALE